MDYENELESIQIWIKATAGLNSSRLKNAKPLVARPVILFETPSRGKRNNLDRYRYTVPVRQYCKLFVNSLDEANRLQELLIKDIEEKVNILQLYDNKQPIPGALLKAVTVTFDNGDGLDIPFTIAYEVTYSRTRPADAPAATLVTNKIVTT